MTWWIALTQPSCERRAAAGAGERGFETWCPMRKVEFKTRHMKAKAVREYPTFPGYLFIRTCAARHLLSGVDGLRALLCNDWTPLTVSDDEVDRVRRRIENPVRMVEDAWKIGDTVLITDGPFIGFSGEITKGGRRGTLAVLMHLFGRDTPTEVSLDQIERRDEARKGA